MLNTIKTSLAAAAIATLPMMASAATIDGQLDIAGNVNLTGSSFNASGNVDLLPSGGVINATGDFASSLGFLDVISLVDIDFSTPGAIFTAGEFTFTATSFSNFVDTAASVAFSALGVVSSVNYDDTVSLLTFSAQPNGVATQVSFSSTVLAPAPVAPVPVPAAGLLLLTALGGAAAMRRRKKAATA